MNTLNIFMLLLLVTATTANSCGTTSFGASSGTVKSYSTSYARSSTCTYRINVFRRWVRLTWNSFDVDGKMPHCYDDYVEVYIGCGINRYKISRFCSRNMNAKPHDIYSKDGCIEIIYRTLSSGKRSKGFLASYQSYSLRQSAPKFSGYCSSNKKYRTYSGVIGSPRWPQSYRTSDFRGSFNRECEWDIETRDSTKLIKLNFMDMDVYQSGFSCSAYLKDRVQVKGKKSVLTSSKYTYTYCKKSPFSLTTKYYELDIEMDVGSHSSYRNRGFVVGWVAYTDDNAKNITNWGMIGGLVICVIFVVIVAFICYRRYKRRQPVTYTQTISSGYGASTAAATTVVHPPSQPGMKTTYPPPQQPYPQQQQPYQQPYQQQGYPSAPPPSGYPTAGYYPEQAPPPYPGPPAPGPMPYPPPQQGAAQQFSAPYPPPQDFGAAPYPPAPTDKSSAPPI